MEIIEQIGSYAGLAAIVGLAVLSALYFSQARDVRRLRELEQAREQGLAAPQPTPGRGPLRPTAAPIPTQAQPAPTQVHPAPAAAGASGPDASQDQAPSDGDAQQETGEQAGAGAPSEAAPQGAPSEAAPQKAAADAPAGNAKPAAASAAGAAAAAAKSSGTSGGGPALAPESRPPAPAPDTPRTPGRPPPPRLPATRPGTTLRASAPPSLQTRGPAGRGRLAPRYVALILAGLVVLTAGAIYAVTTLGGDDGAGTAAEDGQSAGDEAPTPFDPSTIEVAVLNGTSVSGLAGQVADSVQSAGFQRGNVANATDSGATAESVVLFADGARRAARQVGQELGIGQIEPLDSESRAVAGAADVVVIVGEDQAQ